jgi:hypothetical protein
VTATVSVGTYVFGVVPVGTAVPSVDPGGPTDDLHLVEAGDLAALVGRVGVDRPLGRAVDLRCHEQVLSDLARDGTPVLPMRFGAVLTDDDAVRDELLVPNREAFLTAMDGIRGRVQYSLKVRYEEDVVLAEVVGADPQIRRLRESSAGTDDPGANLQLGRLVVQALERLRPTDAAEVQAALPQAVDVRVREVGPPDEVFDAGFLVEAARSAKFEDEMEQVAARFARRMRFTLGGPTAAWDFVGES